MKTALIETSPHIFCPYCGAYQSTDDTLYDDFECGAIVQCIECDEEFQLIDDPDEVTL